MRFVKIALIASIVAAVFIPFSIIVLLVGVAFIGGVASNRFDDSENVRTISHPTQAVQPVATSTSNSNRVQLQHSDNLSPQEAQAVMDVLNSRLGFGETGTTNNFRLVRNNGIIQMHVLPSMPRELCEALLPVYEILATIISQHCFDGQRFEAVLLPSESSDAMVSVSRDDVKTCWFDGNQSVFFENAYEPELLETIVGQLRAINLIGVEAEPGNFFIREFASKTQVNQLGLLRGIEAVDPKQLSETLRDKAVLFSVGVTGGVDCEYRLTDARFEKVLRSFEFSPPFRPSAAARNGCFLFLGDDSVPQSTLNAIADRISALPGREITIDVWLQQIGSEVLARLPMPIAGSADDGAARRSLYATGVTIASELPPGVNVRIQGCDAKLRSQLELTVTQRDGDYVARDDSRLFYSQAFDETFANQLADFFVSSGAFAPNNGMEMKLSSFSDDDATPRLQMVSMPHQLTAEEIQQFKVYGQAIATDMFADTGLVFEVCDVYGNVIGSLQFRYSRSL